MFTVFICNEEGALCWSFQRTAALGRSALAYLCAAGDYVHFHIQSMTKNS